MVFRDTVFRKIFENFQKVSRQFYVIFVKRPTFNQCYHTEVKPKYSKLNVLLVISIHQSLA